MVGHSQGRIRRMRKMRLMLYSDSTYSWLELACRFNLTPIAVSQMMSNMQRVITGTTSNGADEVVVVVDSPIGGGDWSPFWSHWSPSFATSTFDCSLMIGRKSSRMRKWKAGVRILRRRRHLARELVTRPSPSQLSKKWYSTDFCVSVLLLRMTLMVW